MIGARDMAFPRLNAFGYWMFLFGGLFMYTSFPFGAAPNAGWFSYAPLTETDPSVSGCLWGTINQQSTLAAAQTAAKGGQGCFAPGPNMDFWVIGIILLGIASLSGAINFIVTILRMRAPGLTINRMPLFTWMKMITAFLLVFALPSLTVASFFLLFDRHLGTHFFQAANGGDPLLWQHLFWSFGHPEVYILILPAFGMISEILPVFSGKPIFGYTFVAWSGVAIGFLSFTVWAHHMFAVGLPTIAQAFFATSTTLIAIPTAVKIFNWVGTHLWRAAALLHADALRGRLHRDVPDRRPERRGAGDRAVRLSGDRHLLRRLAHPLRALRRRGAGHLRRHLSTGSRSSSGGC